MTITDWAPPTFTGEPTVVLLTPMRADTLECLCRGMSNQAIADQMFVSPETVRSHVKAVFKALNANDRAHAVALVFTGQVRIQVATYGGR